MRQYMWLARSRPILLLLLAWGISYAGDMAAYTVASVYLYRAGGAGYVGLLGVEWALSAAILVPLVSSWSDRVRRERLLTGMLIPRALLLGAAGAAMSGHGQAMLVAVLLALDGGLCSVFRPVQAALLPWLARTPDELTSANTAASVMQAAAVLVGPAIAALLSVGTAQSATFVTCGLVAAAAVLLAGVRPLAAQVPTRAARILKQLRLDVAAGLTACIRQLGAPALVVPAAAQTFARGVLNVLTVVIALDLFDLGPGRRPAGRGARRGRHPWHSACRRAGPREEGGALLRRGGRGLGSAYGPARVHARAILAVPALRRRRGRQSRRRCGRLQRPATGDTAPPDGTCARGAPSCAPAIGRPWLRRCTTARPRLPGPGPTLAGVGLLLIAIAIVSVPSLKAVDSRLSAPGPEGRAAAPGVVLRPAAVCHGRAPGQRAAVCDVRARGCDHPGRDLGESFYLIAAGRARASRGGRQLSEMGAADSFGEIALLREIPRTATVTAISRLNVWILEREEFLAAVTGSPESAESADAVVSARLQVG